MRVSPLLAMLLALGFAAATSADDETDDAPQEGWMEVVHRQLPLSFEVPEETSLQRVDTFSMVQARTQDRRRVEVDLFGLRPLPGNSAAVQFAFFWVTPEYQGAAEPMLRVLPERTRDPRAFEEFLRAVFFRGLQVRFEDLGADFADGRPGRRVSLARVVAPGTAQQREIRGEALIIPLDRHATLVAIARFDPDATRVEREHTFPRVLRSLRVGAPDLLEPRQQASQRSRVSG